MLSARDLIHSTQQLSKINSANFILEIRQLVYILCRFTAHAGEVEKFRTGVNRSDVSVKF